MPKVAVAAGRRRRQRLREAERGLARRPHGRHALREGTDDPDARRRSPRPRPAWAARSRSSVGEDRTDDRRRRALRVRRPRWSRSSPTWRRTRSSRKRSCRASRPTGAPALHRQEPAAAARAGEVPRGALRRPPVRPPLPDRGDAPGLHARPGAGASTNATSAPRARASTSSAASTPPSMEAAIREAFARLEARRRRRTPPKPKPSSERAVYLVDRPGAVQSTIDVGPARHRPPPAPTAIAAAGHEHAARRLLLVAHHLQHPRAEGLHVLAAAQLSTRYRDAYWVENADVTTAVTGPSLKEIFDEIDRLQAEPPTEEELAAVKNYLAGTFVLQNSLARRHHRPARVRRPARPAGGLPQRRTSRGSTR